MGKKRRIGYINFIRIFCMIWILLFHARIHYGFVLESETLNLFISIGAIGCTGFFMMSGFNMRYKDIQESCQKKYCEYIINKMIGIFPIYYFMLIVSIVFKYDFPNRGVF